MISLEFKAAISVKNLLRTRIMLKDSLIVDPTFEQFNEMLAYAESKLSNLFVPFDGERLENDRTKWNEVVMNEELVKLVTNFSEKRVEHLKEVVAKVLESKAAKIRCEKNEQNKTVCQQRSGFPSIKKIKSRIKKNWRPSLNKEFDRDDASRSIELKLQKINELWSKVKE